MGLFCSLASPAIVEMIGWAGFHFVILDAEHSLVGPEELAHQLRAADAVGLRALVRLPSATSSLAGPVLDAGAAGVVIPRVRSASDVEAAVRAARYHPWGGRGLDAGRATRYGQADLRQAVRQAAGNVAVVAMIEDRGRRRGHRRGRWCSGRRRRARRGSRPLAVHGHALGDDVAGRSIRPGAGREDVSRRGRPILGGPTEARGRAAVVGARRSHLRHW